MYMKHKSARPTDAVRSKITPGRRKATHTVALLAAAVVLLTPVARAAANSAPVGAPGAVAVTAATATSVDLAWAAPSGAAGYDIFWNGKFLNHTGEARYSVSGLACGASYTVSVAAFDAAQQRSARTSALVGTAPCAPQPTPAPAPAQVTHAAPAAPAPTKGKPDTTRPSTPTALTVSDVKPTGFALAWKPSTDNVGVVGYTVFVAGEAVKTASTSSSVVSGLTCGTSVLVGVEALDAAGNRSTRAQTTTSTAACGSAAGTSASLFVATSGSDAGSCTKTAPCKTLSRAYQLAKPGATVEIAGGTYPSQLLTYEAKPSSDPVVFRPAAGTNVTLAEFVSGDTKKKIGAQNFELRDLAVSSYVRVRWGSENVVLRNIDAGGINLTSARGVKVLGGDFGPMVDGVSHINACGVEGCTPAEDILIDGAYFHDYTITDPKKHSECLMIWPGRNVTIRNSTFRNCTDFDVLVKPYKTSLVGLPGEITFENNLFDEPIIGDGCLCNRGGNAIAITQGGGESWSGVRIRNNSSLGGFRVDPAITGAVIENNIARKDSNYSCQKNVSFAGNVWTGAKCSPTDRTAPFSEMFVNPAAFDLRLLPAAKSLTVGATSP